MVAGPATSGDPDPPQPPAPKSIRKLAADVVNQIAAAEILHRPANAVKELIENSLDAGATSVKITVKDGGLKLLQITDNGHGVKRDDLPLLCERFATSKLVTYSDLESIATYGFRGEALASISYCSHLEVVTKTRSDSCGWKAQYENGLLKNEPKPTAANDGTVITAEDLFYNNTLRKRAFRSPSDEYTRILDVISKYAVHNPGTAWVCKKAGSALPDVTTAAGSTSKEVIAALYTSALAAELLELPNTVFDAKLGASCRGWVTNANTNWGRKGAWLLFINNRLVDSSKIKKAIDGLYTTFLPKGATPFVYISLQIDPAKVDVNVHPTKSEVHFLHEDEIVESLVTAVNTALAGANTSRTFKVQTLLPGAPAPKTRDVDEPDTPKAPNYKVRMDPTNRTLDSMFSVSNPSQLTPYSHVPGDDDRPSKRRAVGGDDDVQILDDSDDDATPLWNASKDSGRGAPTRDIPESVCEFASIQDLRRAVRKRASDDLTETLRKHAFVGVADRHQCLSLVQHSTRLLMVNHAALADEHFYQLGLRQFGALGRLRLDPSPDLADLLRLAADDEAHRLEENGLNVDQVVEDTRALLMSKREMIDEYFSLGVSPEGAVECIPLLLRDYTPNLDRLPHFLLCLATRVNWKREKECFETVLRELAFFYSPRPFDDAAEVAEVAEEAEEAGEAAEEAGETKGEIAHQLWQLEHVLFPSMRKHTLWPRDIAERDVKQVANLPDLFRVFERC